MNENEDGATCAAREVQEETGYLPTGLSEEDSYTVVGLFTFLFFNVLSRNWWLRLSVMLPDFSENCPYVCACGMHHLRLLLVDAHHVVCLITSGKFVPLFWSSFADACAPPPSPPPPPSRQSLHANCLCFHSK